MKICQNKALRVAVIAGLILITARGDLTSALAQSTTFVTNEGPVNLLGPSALKITNKGGNSGGAVTTIDDALNLITDDIVKDATIDQKTQNLVPSMTQPAPTNAPAATLAPESITTCAPTCALVSTLASLATTAVGWIPGTGGGTGLSQAATRA